MGKVIYPERFRDIDPVSKADEIFKTFTGIAAYERLKKEYQGFGRVVFREEDLVVR